MGTQQITDLVNSAASEVAFGIWFLIGVALVFFMQCGFAMVEAGFTRAKNSGNIIMKNLMDFCLGAVAFMVLGFSLLFAEDYLFGIIGIPNFDIFTSYASFDWSNFIFNLVFCATAATIVAGAMAERTRFTSYCLYSVIISAVVYPVSAGWVWNSQGWLAQLGFIDFAGSAAIHMLGGIAAFIGAAFLGARIGKYDKNGKAKAIPGHNLTIGALGVFILWFGWYGFNGAAASSVNELGSIFITTTISPAVATISAMAVTWIRNGKPDISMSLNGSLAGLVAVTAGCAEVDALGAAIIGLVAGILLVVAVEVIDKVFKVDDPVGASAVHGANGIWGTLAVGLFATDGGLFYGGDFNQLGVQALGVVAISAWSIVTMCITFAIIKKTIGLRVNKEEEITGLDIAEHGLATCYADFMPTVSTLSLNDISASAGNGSGVIPVNKAVPVSVKQSGILNENKITKIDIICKQSKFEALKNALNKIGICGMTVTQVLGCGIQKGKSEYYRGVEMEVNLLPKVQVEMVVCKVPVESVIESAISVLYTGHIGDGKIFVYNVEDVVKVRTGERGCAALQDVE